MPHEIETMVGMEAAWHHTMTNHNIVKYDMTGADAMREAQLDWTVEKRQVFIANKDGLAIPVPKTFCVTRVKDDAPYGVVSDKYNVFQNQQLFDTMEELVKDTGKFRFRTAGALNGGQRVWGLLEYLEMYEVVPGIEHKTFLFGSLTHDGTGAVNFFDTDVCVVCANTWASAMRGADEKRIFRIPHIGDMEVRIEEARKILNLVHKQLESNQELMADFQRIVLNEQAAMRFLNGLFPLPEIPSDGTELEQQVILAQRERLIETQQKLAELMEGGRVGRDFPEVHGTAYGWFQAVTEYTTHEMNRRDRSVGGNLNAIAFGEAGRLNKTALRLLSSEDLVAA